MRKSGVLLHITSLPSKGGVGTMGECAKKFVDILHASHTAIWQVLPVGPTGYGESPYQSGSCMAGNPLFIDQDALCAQGLLTEGEIAALPESDDKAHVDYELALSVKDTLLRKAFARAKKLPDFRDKQDAFCKENAWVRDYALFAAVKRHFNNRSWMEWPDRHIRMREADAMKKYLEELAEDVEYAIFQQRIFFAQWYDLKRYANERGVKLFGDMPIYVAEDSADAWTNPEEFQFDAGRHPVRVSGVPPDYFSADGQLWGNPLYDWRGMKKNHYAWWVMRMRAMSRMYDMIRIDHFIGFANYYSIRAGAKNARFGYWVKGPQRALFETLKREVPDITIIAEDLGCVNARVRKLLKWCGYPGMKVLQFSFDGGSDNPHALCNFKRNCIAYTGTHDNDTVMGWWKVQSAQTKENARKVLHLTDDAKIVDAMIRAVYASKAGTVVIPMQELLQLSDARMNLPGSIGGNWQWRMKPEALSDALTKKLLTLNHEYARETK